MNLETENNVTRLLLLLLLQKRKRNNMVTKKQNRRWWVRPVNRNRERTGEYRRLVIEMKLHDDEWFFTYTRMNSALFEQLLSLVGPHIVKRSIRKPLTPAQRLAMTLRYLATGDSYFSIASGYNVGKSTVCTVVREVTEIIWEVLSSTYLCAPSKDKLKEVADAFWKSWNAPHCVGSIDGKHIRIFAPPKSGSMYYNYKNYFSIVLLGVSDADYNFLYVDIGGYGSVSDGGTFSNSAFGRSLLNCTIPLPEESTLPGSNVQMKYYFAGDAAFPLLPNLMRPYPGKNLNVVHGVFNYRLSRARRVIENTFGILVARWRIFHRSICAAPDTIDNVIKSTVCLHNFIRASKPARERYAPTCFVDGEDVLGKWRDEVEDCIVNPCQRLGSNNASLAAYHQREILAKYFVSSAGFKKGQIEYVKRK